MNIRVYLRDHPPGNKLRVLGIGCPKCEHEIEVADLEIPLVNEAEARGWKLALEWASRRCVNGFFCDDEPWSLGYDARSKDLEVIFREEAQRRVKMDDKR